MLRPWSISTTLRNPERIKQFLMVLKTMENQVWNSENQIKFQVLLIQNRLYGFNNNQFLNSLSKLQFEKFSNSNIPLDYKFAEEIFYNKKYVDPAMRGRQSLNPLKKLGFISLIDDKIVFNDIANKIILEESDWGDIFLKCFLKWQIPNLLSNDYKEEDGYNIIPFVGTLKLFYTLHNLVKDFKGLSKEEFSIFIPTLINYEDIEFTAKQIIDIRKKIKSKNNNKKDLYINFILSLKGNDNINIKKYLQNLQDYGDNIFRYFRLTRFFKLRGNGYFIDIEDKRYTEIKALLEINPGNAKKFSSILEYQNYLKNENLPKLPWIKEDLLITIAQNLINECESICNENSFSIPDEINSIKQNIKNLDEKVLNELRKIRQILQSKVLFKETQDLENLKKYILELENIEKSQNKALELEKLITYCILALNDALKIQPNFPVDDNNQPIFFAPANKPDIECYYESFNAICEVTTLKSRDQWYNEGQPVMRHLRDFENKSDKTSYCLFIAPILHRDTLNTFWISNKYEFEGEKQRIIPLTILEFIKILNIFLQIKMNKILFSHNHLLQLFDLIIQESIKVSDVINWRKSFYKIINNWGQSILENKNGN